MSLPYTLKWIIPFRDYFIRGLQTLPLTIAGLAWFFSITTASFTFMMYALVMTIVIPVIVGLLQYIIKYSTLDNNKESILYSNLEKAANCNLVFGNNASLQVLPSYWLTSVVFFFATILGNAVVNYITPQGPYASDTGYLRRRIQSIFSIISIVIIFFIVLISRLTSGCEGTSIGVRLFTLLISSLIGGGFAVAITFASKEYSLDIFNMFLYSSDCNKDSTLSCIYVAPSNANPDLLNQLKDNLNNNTTLLEKMKNDLKSYMADNKISMKNNFIDNITSLISISSSYSMNTIVNYFNNNLKGIETLNASIQDTSSMTDSGMNSFISQIKEVSKNLNTNANSIAKQQS